jgi:hypothetical protein
MNYSLGNMLSRGGALNPDWLALDLQFAADKTLTARKGPTPTFTRASTATFVGSNGLIQTAAINAPRFDHDPVTLASRGLLIEESRTNLLQRSEGFDNSYWSKQTVPPVSVAADVALAPNGETTADILRPATSAGSFHFISRVNIALTNVSHTATVFMKASGYNFAELIIGSNILYSKFATAYFNLSTGEYVTSRTAGYTVASYSITPVGNGWYRCSLTVVTDANSTGVFTITCGSTTNPVASFAGDGISGILLWGAQLEAGSFPTSYIPTTTASVVRSADVCSITGSDFSGFYNQSEGTLFVGVTPQPTAQLAAVLLVNTNTFNNIQSISKADSGGSGSGLRWVLTQNPPLVTAVANLDEANVFTKLSMGYKSGDSALYYNNKFGSSTSSVFTSIAPTQMQIGSRDSQRFINGHISEVKYFKKRLPNAKLQSLTA